MTSARHWLSEPGGTPEGPYELAELRALAAAGKLSPRMLACKESTTDWVPLSALLETRTSVAGSPPPSPPPPPPTALLGSGARAGSPSAEDQALGFMVPIGADPVAIAASYFGLFGLLIWPLALAALAMGVIAFRRRSRYPHTANTVRCVVSIVLGALGTAAGTVVLVALLLSR